MSLETWVNNDWLARQTTSVQEITDLFSIADRDLHDCKIRDLSPDWRHNIAYNAALQLAKAALAASGYKATRNSHHYYTIQSLKYTIELDTDTIDLFDTFRNKRAISDYDRAGLISDGDAEEMIELAENLRTLVENWIKTNHSHLLRK